MSSSVQTQRCRQAGPEKRDSIKGLHDPSRLPTTTALSTAAKRIPPASEWIPDHAHNHRNTPEQRVPSEPWIYAAPTLPSAARNLLARRHCNILLRIRLCSGHLELRPVGGLNLSLSAATQLRVGKSRQITGLTML